jgi:RimJ/RimL family protein N-acetyltransferase
MSRVIGETARLILRTEKPGDQAAWLAHMNTPAVLACLGGPRPPEKIAESFARMAQGWESQGFSFMLLERKADGMLIGHCGISLIDGDDTPETLRDQPQIGWMLREDAWGQGYAAEAANGVFALAFGAWDMPVVYGQTSLSNQPSWRLMKRLRMTRRADLDYIDFRYPPEDNPTMVYRLDRADWRARNEDER